MSTKFLLVSYIYQKLNVAFSHVSISDVSAWTLDWMASIFHQNDTNDMKFLGCF